MATAVVLAVELANEPHTSDNYERRLGLVPGAVIKAWSCAMAEFIKSIDHNHMVTLFPALSIGILQMPYGDWRSHATGGPNVNGLL